MAVTVYKKTALTGGAAGSLDGIDGAGLLDADMAFVTVAGVIYEYILDDDDGGIESSPSRIIPDANAGNKRWLLQSAYAATVVAADLAAHAALTSPHSATSAATPSRVVVRDASGRAKFAAPAASDDVAIKSTVDDHAALTTAHGAVSTATASKLVVRDASGRAAFATPAASGDAATKGYVDGAIALLSDFKNLKITTTGAANNQSVLLTANKVIVVTTADLPKLLSAVSVAINLGASGANGLDTGSLAANTGYFLYVISNGSTTAGLASLSASTPTMPSGYTYKALVGWCTTDATATPFNIEEFTQVDDEYVWAIPQEVISTGSGATTVAVDLSATGILGYAAIPPNIVKKILTRNSSYHTNLVINPTTFANSLSFGGEGNGGGVMFVSDSAGFAWTHSQATIPIIESQKIYAQSPGGYGYHILISGFTMKR